MAYETVHPWPSEVWELAERQHGALSRAQLGELGLPPHAIEHRIAAERLFPVHSGVYAVGRPRLSTRGCWMAGVLACGEGAVLSHLSAARLWGIWEGPTAVIEISVPVARRGRRPGILVHRRRPAALDDATTRARIPVTSVARTIIDVAPRLRQGQLERAIGEADRLDLIDPDQLRAAAAAAPRFPGASLIVRTLDQATFRLTDSELERRFLRVVRRLDLGLPDTGVEIDGLKVDFFWPKLGLVVETDGLRYHRTAGQQTADRRRDQLLSKARLRVLRFTHSQIRFRPGEVEETLRDVAAGPTPPGRE